MHHILAHLWFFSFEKCTFLMIHVESHYMMDNDLMFSILILRQLIESWSNSANGKVINEIFPYAISSIVSDWIFHYWNDFFFVAICWWVDVSPCDWKMHDDRMNLLEFTWGAGRNEAKSASSDDHSRWFDDGVLNYWKHDWTWKWEKP